MWVIGGSDICHLDAVTAFRATLKRAFAGDLKVSIYISQRPKHCVCLTCDRQEQAGFRVQAKGDIHTVSHLVSWESAGTPVQPTYCSSPADLTIIGSSRVPVTITPQIQRHSTNSLGHFYSKTAAQFPATGFKYPIGSNCFARTLPRRIQRLHVEDINSLHLSQKFEPLKTSRLLDIGGQSTGFGTGCTKIGFALDLWIEKSDMISFHLSKQI